MKKAVLEDFKINIKIKLAFLWASVTFFYLYGDYFELYIPGKTAGLIDGNNLLNSPVKLFLASLLLAIPALMVCFSILAKPRLNKLLNILVGLFFTAIMLLIAITSISEWRAFYVFYAILESVLTFVIVWTAIKWPKKTDLT
ncbi:DUF6326 family protein [Flavobacterium sp. LC2016-12]|uniref:DUF6326 family protein n=1 Tax=Flavobacterium sp. LC2016-12 TaxID=2783794 RepID=UPI00188BBE45|nr:DUF6326 family protein [Flavobacterium sp. LC2016-12]MBF4466304.1 hypothetical protein [Flavobacterium sp. LC2016-12]